jgi:hypothetical protein
MLRCMALSTELPEGEDDVRLDMSLVRRLSIALACAASLQRKLSHNNVI